MHAHETQPATPQPHTSAPKANPFAPLGFDTAGFGQERADVVSNPFARRPDAVDMGPTAVSLKAAEPTTHLEPEANLGEIGWPQFRFHAPDRPAPAASAQTQVQRQEESGVEAEEESEEIQAKSLDGSIDSSLQRQAESEDEGAAPEPPDSEAESEEIQTKAIDSQPAPSTPQSDFAPTLPPRPATWMWPSRVSLQPESPVAQPEAETKPSESNWLKFDLYAAGQTPPSPPRWTGVQPKLSIGRPNDAYEQEADRVAAEVMAMPETAPQVQRQTEADEEIQTKPLVQRQVEEEATETEEEEIQAKPLSETIPPLVQRQAEEETTEEEEIQAKPLAETITPLVQRQTDPEALDEEVEVQPKPLMATIAPLVQRQEQEGEEIQAKAGGSEPLTAGATLEQQLSQQQGKGSPLSEEVRSFMEPRFGTDFGQVRVHTGAESVQMNRDLRAQAFTHGNDIYFGSGKAANKDDLTAHELTHVVQQTGAKRLNLKRQTSRNKPPELEKSSPFSGTDTPHNGKDDRADSKAPLESKQDSGPEQSALTAANQPPKSESAADLGGNPQPDNGKPGAALGVDAAKTVPKVKSELSQAVPGQNKAKLDLPADKAQPVPAPGAGNAVIQKPLEESAAKANANAGGSSGVGAALADIPAAANAAPALDVGGGAAEGEAEPVVADDPELEATAAMTEGVTLESADRAEAQAMMAEVGAAGGGGGGAAAGGGGGGGGGAAIVDKPAPTVPDVSQSEPSQALAAISQLPPAQLLGALGSVKSAVNTSVGQQKAELAANPPQMERPSGAPMTGEGKSGEKPLANKDPKPVEKAAEGQAKPVPQPKPVAISPAPPVQAAAPAIAGNAEGKLSDGDVQALKNSVRQMPTHDPGLNIPPVSPPPLELQGDADPQQAQEQKAKLEKGLTETHTQGQQDLAAPTGENEIYPKVPKETLRAEVGGGSAGGGAIAGGAGAAGAMGAMGDDAISIIAQQEHGAEIQAAVAQAQGQMATQKQEHTAKVAEEKTKSDQEISKLQTDNAKEQDQERTKAQTEVEQQKASWSKEQTERIDKSRQDSDSAVAKGLKEVEQEQTQAESEAAKQIEKGNQDAEAAKKEGEDKAAAEHSKVDQDGGFFGWLASKAKDFFDGIKQGIQKAFEFARAAVKAAIDAAQKFATELIEKARQKIVGMIKAVGDTLIAIGDQLLVAFPEMRDRFRGAIKGFVQKAETAVNALADNLKQGVQASLNLLGKGLDGALGLLEKGCLAAVDVANQGVQGVISATKAAVDTLGAFAALAGDIATNPTQWLSNLGSGAKDGIQNHLWSAFQAAVQAWFSSKVEETLGLGLTIWNLLKQGGMDLAAVGKMAWEGIKEAIPQALIEILIEKLVSMIVPAAGTVMLIIEGLQAAWGTASRILQAMERFMAFMKAVKSGQSGAQFGAMVAAAGVAVIDFVSNWLLKRISGAASKVGNKIKEIASKLGSKLKKAFTKLKKGAGKLKDKFFGKAGSNKDKKDKTKGFFEEAGSNKDKTKSNKSEKDKKQKEIPVKSSKIEKDKVKEEIPVKSNKIEKDKDDVDKKRERVDTAVEMAVAQVNQLSGKSVSKSKILPVLQVIRSRFGLNSLEAKREGEFWSIHGHLNPSKKLITTARASCLENKVDANFLTRWRPGFLKATKDVVKPKSGEHICHETSIMIDVKKLQNEIEGKSVEEAFSVLNKKLDRIRLLQKNNKELKIDRYLEKLSPLQNKPTHKDIEQRSKAYLKCINNLTFVKDGKTYTHNKKSNLWAGDSRKNFQGGGTITSKSEQIKKVDEKLKDLSKEIDIPEPKMKMLRDALQKEKDGHIQALAKALLDTDPKSINNSRREKRQKRKVYNYIASLSKRIEKSSGTD